MSEDLCRECRYLHVVDLGHDRLEFCCISGMPIFDSQANSSRIAEIRKKIGGDRMNFCPVCGSEPVIYVAGKGLCYYKVCGWRSDVDE